MTVLIGPNNSGKTTVLKALGLALGDYGRYVTEEDFYIGTDGQGNETKANEIIVDVRKQSSDEADLAEFERALLELKDFGKCWTNFRRKGLGESLSAFRNAMALGQLAEDISTSGLTLSTVHTMKGLEKDIVFLMGMCEGTFPDYRAKNPREIEEERNNAFVAVTRSRRWIFITYPQAKMMPWKDVKRQVQSRFITEMTSNT